MEGTLLLKFVCAFVFVIGLMLLLPHILKKAGLTDRAFAPGGKRRLKIVEFMALDHKRKLVLVRRDNKEHLIVLGPESETVVETNISAPEETVVELPQKD